MKFGIALPGRGPLATPDVVLRLAERAEALGFASVFVSDHVVLPVSGARSTYPYHTSGRLPGGAAQDYLEPLALLGALAVATRRVCLGTSVLVLPYRHPLVVAKMLATADVLSGGRVILGVGTGWLREEFEALGAPPFEARGAATDEAIALLRRAWTTDPTAAAGKFWPVPPVHALPKPLQRGGIPIWVGGHTEPALRRAAALGDGWHPIGLRPPAILEPDEYAALARRLCDLTAAAGRDPAAVELTLRAPMRVVGPGRRRGLGSLPLLQGTADEVLAAVRRYAAAGVAHLVFDAAESELRLVVDGLERFAADVRPRVGGLRGRRADGR